MRSNVGLLSRKLVVLQHNTVRIHDECRFPNLVTVVARTNHHHHHHPSQQQQPQPQPQPHGSDPVSSSYILSLGDNDQVWMKFCVSVQQQVRGSYDQQQQPCRGGARHHGPERTTNGPRVLRPFHETGAMTDVQQRPKQKSVATISVSSTIIKYQPSGGSSSQLINEKSVDRKLPAVTPTTKTTGRKKRQRQDESSAPASSQGTTTSSSYSDGSNGCKRRLFATQIDTTTDEKVVVVDEAANSQDEKRSPPTAATGTLRPLQLWSSNSNNTLSSPSYLSLPMPLSDEATADADQLGSQPLPESTQPIEWTSGGGKDGGNNSERKYCADLGPSEWKSMQNNNNNNNNTAGNKGMFVSAMVDLIVSRNADTTANCDNEVWIPSLLASAKLSNNAK
jgi:hypothetical protein